CGSVSMRTPRISLVLRTFGRKIGLQPLGRNDDSLAIWEWEHRHLSAVTLQPGEPFFHPIRERDWCGTLMIVSARLCESFMRPHRNHFHSVLVGREMPTSVGSQTPYLLPIGDSANENGVSIGRRHPDQSSELLVMDLLHRSQQPTVPIH